VENSFLFILGKARNPHGRVHTWGRPPETPPRSPRTIQHKIMLRIGQKLVKRVQY